MADEVRLHLPNFRPLPNDGTRRRQYNVKTGEIISRREFAARAKRLQVKPKPQKERENVRRKRERWYANHINREAYLREAPQDAYISFDEAGETAEFVMYENLIRSSDRDIRDIGYQFFSDLEWEYNNVPWGDT